jgi:hypothetical protein
MVCRVQGLPADRVPMVVKKTWAKTIRRTGADLVSPERIDMTLTLELLKYVFVA